MIRFLFSMSLLAVVFQSIGKNANLDIFLHPMVDAYATEVKNCNVDDLNINSLSSLKGVCRGLVDSGFCSEIEDEYIVDCNKLIFDRNDKPRKIPNYIQKSKGMGFGWDGHFHVADAFYTWSSESDEYEMKNLSTLSFVKKCGIGIGQSSWSTVHATALVIGALVAVAYYLKGEDRWSTEVINNIASAWNYIKSEADRLEDIGFSWPFIRALFIEPVKDEYKEFGCLNEEGQTKVMCQLVTDVATVVVPKVITGAVVGPKTAVAVTATTGGVVATGMASSGATVAGATGGVATGAVGGVVTGGAVAAGVVAGALTIGTLKFIAKRVMKSVKKRKALSSNSVDTKLVDGDVARELRDRRARLNNPRLTTTLQSSPRSSSVLNNPSSGLLKTPPKNPNNMSADVIRHKEEIDKMRRRQIPPPQPEPRINEIIKRAQKEAQVEAIMEPAK